MAGLLSLPNEILQHIASFSTCSSVLNLLRVNRQLRNACNDRLVFQNLARRDLNSPPVANRNNSLPWSERESILASGSLDELARLAFGAEKGIEASLAEDNSWTLKISKRSNNLELSNWLPQMLLLKQSAAVSMSPEIFLEVQGKQYSDDENRAPGKDFPTINFILTYLLLNKLSNGVDAQSIKGSFDRFFSETDPGDPVMTARFGSQVTMDSVDNLRERVPNYGELKDNFDINQATALLPVLFLELAAHYITPVIPEWLPSPGKIPFSSMLDIPALFQDRTPPSFSEWNIRKMANADFLTGTWMGFYSDQRRGMPSRFFDPPMQDINIVARAPSSNVSRAERVAAVIERTTRGVDARGEFSLQGYVSESGFVHATKQYLVAGWSWSWLGRLTPFGIVGVWGGGYDDFGGYIWVWKKEWCEKEW